MVSPPAFLHPHHPGKLSRTALASSPMGQFFCSHNLGSSSPTLIPPGPALLFCLGQWQGPLSQLLQLVRGRVSSSILMPLSLALHLLQLARSWGQGGGHIYLTHATIWHTRGGGYWPLSSFHIHRTNSPVQMRGWWGPCQLNIGIQAFTIMRKKYAFKRNYVPNFEF